MHCAAAEGTTCTLIAITTIKMQVDLQRYVVTAIGVRFVTISKIILFYAGISALDIRSTVYI
jgi:hypothetical protein